MTTATDKTPLDLYNEAVAGLRTTLDETNAKIADVNAIADKKIAAANKLRAEKLVELHKERDAAIIALRGASTQSRWLKRKNKKATKIGKGKEPNVLDHEPVSLLTHLISAFFFTVGGLILAALIVSSILLPLDPHHNGSITTVIVPLVIVVAFIGSALVGWGIPTRVNKKRQQQAALGKI